MPRNQTLPWASGLNRPTTRIVATSSRPSHRSASEDSLRTPSIWLSARILPRAILLSTDESPKSQILKRPADICRAP